MAIMLDGRPIGSSLYIQQLYLWLAIESTQQQGLRCFGEYLRKSPTPTFINRSHMPFIHCTLVPSPTSLMSHVNCPLTAGHGRPWPREVRCMDWNRHVPLRSTKSIVVEGLPPIFLIYCHLIFYLASTTTGAVRIWKSARVCVH